MIVYVGVLGCCDDTVNCLMMGHSLSRHVHDVRAVTCRLMCSGLVLWDFQRQRVKRKPYHLGIPFMRGYRFFLGGDRPPPPTAVCNLFLLVDLPRALQQFGSAPEIPVRNPPF